MARGRMISQSVAEDIEFNGMGCEARLLFLMTIPHLDRDGLIHAHPTIMLGKVAPLVMLDLLPKLPSIIQEWINAGLVISYSDGKASVLFFTGFSKNQAGRHYEREAPSIFAAPPGYKRTPKGIEPVDSDNDDIVPPQQPIQPISPPPQECEQDPDGLRTNSGLTPDQVPPKFEVEVNKKFEVVVEVNNTPAREVVPERRKPATTTAEPPVPVPKEIQFVREYERVWCLMPSQYHTEKIADWAERVTFEGWTYALQECANTRNVGKWKYFESILSRVEVEGIGKRLASAAAKVPVNGNVNIGLAAV